MSIHVHVRVFSLHLMLLLLLLLHYLLLLLGELLDLLRCPALLSVLAGLECPRSDKHVLRHCGALHIIWCHPISQPTHGSELILSRHHLGVSHQLSILLALTHALYLL
jgi:hypothetical protein